MSNKPELPSADDLRLNMEFATHPDEDACAKMIRAQHAALRELHDFSGPPNHYRDDPRYYEAKEMAAEVLAVGEAAGLGEAKEEG